MDVKGKEKLITTKTSITVLLCFADRNNADRYKFNQKPVDFNVLQVVTLIQSPMPVFETFADATI